MPRLIIEDDATCWVPDGGGPKQRFDHYVLWQWKRGYDRSGVRTIVGVGAEARPDSAEPLPPGVVRTDLVALSSLEPGLARQYWESFLKYALYSGLRSHGGRIAARMGGGVPVEVRMRDASAREQIVAILVDMARFQLPLPLVRSPTVLSGND